MEGKNGKIHGKGMNAARQISRRFGRTAGARTRSALSDCIVRAVSFGPDPLRISFKDCNEPTVEGVLSICKSPVSLRKVHPRRSCVRC